MAEVNTRISGEIVYTKEDMLAESTFHIGAKGTITATVSLLRTPIAPGVYTEEEFAKAVAEQEKR